YSRLTAAGKSDYDGVGPFHGRELVDVRPRLDLARGWRVFRGADQQLLPLVPHTVRLLSSICSVLQCQTATVAAIAKSILATSDSPLCLLRSRESCHSQTAYVAAGRDRCRRKAMADSRYSRQLRSCISLGDGSVRLTGMAPNPRATVQIVE